MPAKRPLPEAPLPFPLSLFAGAIRGAGKAARPPGDATALHGNTERQDFPAVVAAVDPDVVVGAGKVAFKTLASPATTRPSSSWGRGAPYQAGPFGAQAGHTQ
jgi:hypothetical protein